jgi:Raf kinase inhibitor-like YbhB/YbcL family protein
MAFTIRSTAFNNQEIIPSKYTCDGEDVSPSLKWIGVPDNTKSFVLIMDDPDAVLGTWTHWIIYNIPHDINKLDEDIIFLPSPAKFGQNSWGRENYSGPCPPSGEHRYYFKLYALSGLLEPQEQVTRTNIRQLIKPYFLAETVLMGRYEKNQPK